MRSRKKITLLAALSAMTLMTTINPLAGEWRQREDKWQYILENGQEQRNSWLKTEDGKWYHFDENGMMRTGWYQDTDLKWYYLDADGSMAAGWRLLDGTWYYLNGQSGELLLNGTTPDGYLVDGSGAWTGGSSRSYSDDSSSDSKTKRNTVSKGNENENPGNNSPGGENGGSENPGNNETDGGNNGRENPWENKTPVIMEQSGIVSVLGLPYAVVSFSDEADGQEKFRYSIAGKDVTSSVTPVTTSGSIVKIPLPDENTHTLAITSGEWTVSAILLKEPGNSMKAEKEIAEADFIVPDDFPYLVLANETIPLTQYLKFIRLGDTLYIKPSKTTVDTVQNQSLAEEQNQSPEVVSVKSLGTVQNRGVDAVASATVAPPVNLEGKEETATIAVLFDMIANYRIADDLGVASSSGDAFLAKLDVLENTIALNEDFSLYTKVENLKNRSWQTTGELPRYVKYLTEKANYGTKVEFLTGKTDNTNPPQLTVSPSLKGQNAEIQLSEENETWYRSITEIEIPYSAAKTFYYQDNNTLSEDGKTLVLGVDSLSGPMNYAGTYEVTVHSFEFEDAAGTLSVVERAPTFTPLWDDSNTRLKLKAEFTYYTDKIETVTVNGTVLELNQYTTDINNIYIPYRYLVNGRNTFEIQAAGYENDVFEFDSPESFIAPKRAADLTIEEVAEGSSSPMVFHIGSYQEGSEEMQWFHELEEGHLNLSYTYGTVTGLSLTKEENTFTVTAANTSMSVYYNYTMQIRVPGYDIVTITFTPVKAPPAVTQEWDLGNYSLKLTSTSASYLSSSVTKVILNGTELQKGEGADYTASYADGIEIFAHSYKAGEPYKLELHAPSYAVKVIEGIAPESLIPPLAAPVLEAEAVAKGNSVAVQASGEFFHWLDQINAITMTGTYGSTACTFSKTENGFILDSNNFTYTGDYSVTVKAAGYRNAQVAVKILNTVEITDSINYDEDRLELAAGDSYFYDDLTVVLNGVELTKNAGYTVNGYKMIYIPAELLTEEENHLVLNNEAYEKVEITIGRYTAAKPAPELAVEEVISGENSIVLLADADNDWWELLEQTHISVKRSSSNQTMEGFTRASMNQLMIDLNNPLSYYYDYTVTISVPGYRTCSITFSPYQAVPEIEAEWLENGDLQLSTESSGYFSSSYSAVYLDGEKLVNNTDYSLNTYYPLPYSLTIFAENFTPGDHLVEIRYTGSSNYMPYDVTVTTPESLDDPETGLIEPQAVPELPAEEIEAEPELPAEETEAEPELPAEETEETEEEPTEELPAEETGAEQETVPDHASEQEGEEPSEELPAEEEDSETGVPEDANEEEYTQEQNAEAEGETDPYQISEGTDDGDE